MRKDERRVAYLLINNTWNIRHDDECVGAELKALVFLFLFFQSIEINIVIIVLVQAALVACSHCRRAFATLFICGLALQIGAVAAAFFIFLRS